MADVCSDVAAEWTAERTANEGADTKADERSELAADHGTVSEPNAETDFVAYRGADGCSEYCRADRRSNGMADHAGAIEEIDVGCGLFG